jgi:hypothetical protein
MGMRLIFTLLMLSLPMLTLAGPNGTEIYKSLDAEGNTVYSDTPTTGAEKITPPPISTVETSPAHNPAQPETEDKTTKPPTSYTSFSITQPKNDDVIWDNLGSIPLSLSLEPALDTADGHGVWVYIDGRALVKNSPSLVQPISGIDRGTHMIRAEIRDSAGMVLKRTNTISVHLKKHAAPQPRPR